MDVFDGMASWEGVEEPWVGAGFRTPDYGLSDDDIGGTFLAELPALVELVNPPRPIEFEEWSEDELTALQLACAEEGWGTSAAMDRFLETHLNRDHFQARWQRDQLAAKGVFADKESAFSKAYRKRARERAVREYGLSE